MVQNSPCDFGRSVLHLCKITNTQKRFSVFKLRKTSFSGVLGTH